MGSDEAGARILGELAARGVDLTRVRRSAAPSTDLLLLVDDQGERTIVQRSGLRLDEIPQPEPHELGPGDVVYVASWPGDLLHWLAAAREARALAVPAVGGQPVECDALIHSASEVGRDLGSLRRLLEPDGPVRQALIVTDGPRGARVVTRTHAAATIAAPAVPVVDTTGARDALAAGVIHHLTTGGSWRGAVQEGVLWDGAAVQVDSSWPPPWRPGFDPRTAEGARDADPGPQ